MKILPVKAELFHGDRRTDMTKLLHINYQLDALIIIYS